MFYLQILLLNSSYIAPSPLRPFTYNSLPKLSGSSFGTSEDRSCTFNGHVNLCVGTNKIALLSVAVGLPVSNLLLNSNLDLIVPLYLAVCSYIDNFCSSFYPRMLDSIVKKKRGCENALRLCVYGLIDRSKIV
ncbi:hypothetical protein VIGAN_05243500 [Vigna angularis var. angularis]|uniref:Uncharacterized protein n=1 Tax=Vigna angularis var. angularis TaxID=157739 RepID=A0A0S3S7M3_PHAAN|nr:hypothetical protein VIGAN_05243500 [Vigna angularis var. angularis]